MKKYLNKALIYQWFNSTKFAIVAGVLFWGLYANGLIHNMYREEIYNIRQMGANTFKTIGLENYIVLGIIFLVINIFSFGNNKKSTEIFLYSGPYTKKQIKFNELFCYMITLGIFVVTYLYIAITFYIRNRESFVIMHGYSNIIMIEIMKVILFGMLGIIIMLIVEAMFSNSMIAMIFMLVIPISFILSILRKIGTYYSMWIDRVSLKEYPREELNKLNSTGLFGQYVSSNQIRMRNLFIASIILIVIIVIFLFILKYVQRKNSLESNVGIFGSIWSKKFNLVYISISFGIILSDILLGRYKEQFMSPYYLSEKVSAVTYLTSLGVDLVLSAIAGFLLYIVIKKITKKLA